VGRWTTLGLRVLPAPIPLVMTATSLLLRWHWFSDLVGGYLLGGAVLILTIGGDEAMSPALVDLGSR
jgi:hypothetical protein